MAFLGLRGLIAQSLRDGNQAQALDYAERAFALRPQTPWVVHSLFDMQAQIGAWKEAQETLETGMRTKVVTQNAAAPCGPCCWSSAAAPARTTGSTARR